MIRRVLQIIVFPCLSVISIAHCQPNDSNQAIERICKKWIDSSGIVKILNVEKIAIADDKPKGLAVNISFKFSDSYQEPVVEWTKIKQGFARRGVDIEKLLRYKLLTLLDGYTVNSIRLTIPYDDISIKGAQGEAGFDYDKLIDACFTGSYNPEPEKIINDLGAYKKKLYNYFLTYPHKANTTVGVSESDDKPGLLTIDVSNVLGQVTGKYYEIIHLEIWLKQYPKHTEIFYRLKNVEYGAGRGGAPKNGEDYANARKDFLEGELHYFGKFKSDIEHLIK